MLKTLELERVEWSSDIILFLFQYLRAIRVLFLQYM